MIRRDKNRASVVLWSVGNETPLTPARLAFMTELVNTAHRLDPSRPVTAALETHYDDRNTKVIDDPLGKALDVLGCDTGERKKAFFALKDFYRQRHAAQPAR